MIARITLLAAAVAIASPAVYATEPTSMSVEDFLLDESSLTGKQVMVRGSVS